jgi:S-DNA-T family DNA segregation ATPase FtsK/SpoIIIE
VISSATPTRRQELIAAAVLASGAAFMAVSLGIASVDPSGVLGFAIAAPGRFFYAILHLAAWWVPIYFVALTAMALRRRPMTWESVLLINVFHLPVLTVGALLRLLVHNSSAGSPLIAALERSFTIRGAGVILSLALAVEGLALMQIWRYVDNKARDEDGEHDEPDEREESAVRRFRTIALPAPAESHTVAPDTAAPDTVDLTSRRDDTADVAHSDASPNEEPISFQDQLAALRARMAEGLEPVSDESDEPDQAAESPDLYPDDYPDDYPEDEVVPEAPLPLIFGRRRATEDDEAAEYGSFDDGGFADDELEESNLADSEFDEIATLSLDEDEESYEDEDENEEEDLTGILPEDAPPPAEIAPVRRTRQKYHVPIDGILSTYSDGRYWEIDDTTRDASEVLRVTLEEFGIKAEVTGIRKGPVITMFEILPAPGVKLAKITNLADNIALRLAASSVRIVAPIPGKHAVGIEIPNRERNIVSFAELLQDDEFFESDSSIPIALGKDIAGEAQIVDLAKTPHMLIAGATGSGKSVCVNSIICSVLYRHNPNEVKLILIDPKIVELKFYNDIPHLLTPVITDPKRAFQALQYLIYEMERRYSMLDSLGARDISGFNAKIKRKNLATEPLPYIVVIIDEFADLMATSGKELESTVARLAAMSRAVGIHLVLATQRPSTDVITGLIKANIPSRIAFMVASKVDSRIIIDSQGAEKLLGRGDMLYTSASDPFPVRMQGAFLTEDEVERVVEEVKTFGEPDYIDDEIFIDEDEEDLTEDTLEDPLMEKAIEVVTSSHKASASYLQRRLKVGYNRAARMVEEMERLGIVGPQNGSKPRDVIGSAH